MTDNTTADAIETARALVARREALKHELPATEGLAAMFALADIVPALLAEIDILRGEVKTLLAAINDTPPDAS